MLITPQVTSPSYYEIVRMRSSKVSIATIPDWLSLTSDGEQQTLEIQNTQTLDKDSYYITVGRKVGDQDDSPVFECTVSLNIYDEVTVEIPAFTWGEFDKPVEVRCEKNWVFELAEIIQDPAQLEQTDYQIQIVS